MRKLTMDELGRLSIEETRQHKKTPIVVVLDNIRSANNIGSVFRTSDAFMIEAIYICGISATPPHKEINKTALGATESVAWQYFSTTLEALTALKKENYELLAIEQVTNSILLQTFTPSKPKLAIVLGNEVDGVSQEVLDYCDKGIEIPQLGSKHSFNVSVTAGIVLWDLSVKLGVYTP